MGEGFIRTLSDSVDPFPRRIRPGSHGTPLVLSHLAERHPHARPRALFRVFTRCSMKLRISRVR
jgi:hypothetical protein